MPDLRDARRSTKRARPARPASGIEGTSRASDRGLTMDSRVATAQGQPEPPAPGQCWCCGSTDDPDRMVHLANHPEVALCRPCARWAAKQAWEIEDRDKIGVLRMMR